MNQINQKNHLNLQIPQNNVVHLVPPKTPTQYKEYYTPSSGCTACKVTPQQSMNAKRWFFPPPCQ